MRNETKALMTTCPPRKAEDYAAILFGCYRRSDTDSPEIFLEAAIAVFCGYPEDVVRAVTDPRGGLPSKSKFLPTIFEITEACEAKIRPLLEEERRRRIRADTEADAPEHIDAAAAERRRAVVAAWRAKQALQEATKAGVETPLADMDARKLNGEHRELVKKAINDKIARLSEESASTPVKLSYACLRSLGLLASEEQQGERVA